jgi:hypothetical protein
MICRLEFLLAGAAVCWVASAVALPSVAAEPKLDGVWQMSEPMSSLKPEGGGAIPFTTQGQQVYKDNQHKRDVKNFAAYDRTIARCAAPGTPRVMLTSERFRILQQPDVIMLGFEQNRFQRAIQMDSLPKQTYVFLLDDLKQGGTSMGTSKGRWEGKTLVVTTDGFTDHTLLDDLLPHGFDLNVTEHIRLVGPNTLQDRIEIVDADFYTHPWAAVLTYQRRPEAIFPEEICLDKLQGTASLPNTAGSPPTGAQAQPDAHFAFGLSNQDGLKIGPQGFTVGSAGGLEDELNRNGFAVPMPAAMPAGEPQPTSDPRDFAGAWEQADQYLEEFERLTDMYGSKLPFTALGRKILDRRMRAHDEGQPYITPSIMCRPSGPDWALIHIPVRIYQSKDRLDLFSPMDRTWWQIPINPALALPTTTPTYFGRSRARWEGKELVVETSGFKDRLWLTFRGTPVSPNGKIIHHITKINDEGHWFLQVITEVIDPDYYTRPWKFARALAWRPDMGVPQEYNCEDQPSMAGSSGAIPEPND